MDTDGCSHLKNLTARKWAWGFSLLCVLGTAFVPGPAASSLPETLPADHEATTAPLGGSHPLSQILAEQLHMSTASSLPSPRTQRDPEDKSPAELRTP